MKKQKVYIVATHHVLVNKQTKEREVHERCEFVDDLKKRYWNSATFILDFINKKVLKDRNNAGSYAEFEAYILQRYPEQVRELIAEFRPEEIEVDPIVEEIAEITAMNEDSPTVFDLNTLETGE